MSTTTTPTPKGELQVRLGARFRAVRRSKGLTLRDMARALRCSVNTVRWHESGARMFRADTIAEAAEFLNVDPSLLMQEGSEAAEPVVEAVRSEMASRATRFATGATKKGTSNVKPE